MSSAEDEAHERLVVADGYVFACHLRDVKPEDRAEVLGQMVVLAGAGLNAALANKIPAR